MTSPKVSIVLPVYNGERYLEQSIVSCLRQTFVDWELVVVNDASTDNTQKIIDRFRQEDSRIRCVVHPENRKLPGSLNSGFAVARGRYFTWTSDDNLYRPEALAEMADVLDLDDRYDLVYSDYQVIDANGRSLHEIAVDSPEELVLRNVVGACFLYRRQVHERLSGYDETKFLVEDYDFWLRVSQHFRISPPLRKLLYDYRVHGGTLTSNRSYEVQAALLSLLSQHLPRMGWVGFRKLSYGYTALGYAACHAGLRAKALRGYGAALLLCPSKRSCGDLAFFIARQIKTIFSGRV